MTLPSSFHLFSCLERGVLVFFQKSDEGSLPWHAVDGVLYLCVVVFVCVYEREREISIWITAENSRLKAILPESNAKAIRNSSILLLFPNQRLGEA